MNADPSCRTTRLIGIPSTREQVDALRADVGSATLLLDPPRQVLHRPQRRHLLLNVGPVDPGTASLLADIDPSGPVLFRSRPVLEESATPLGAVSSAVPPIARRIT